MLKQLGSCIMQCVYNGCNPFNFKFVKYARSVGDIAQYLHADGPCIVMTSPGMLQGGPSLEIFGRIASDSRNAVVLTGYTVKGTLADELRRDPDVVNLGHKTLKRRCMVEQISFSAHADYHQTKEFIRQLSVPNVILVHGERNEMTRMKGKLSEEIPELSVFMPEVLQMVTLSFATDKSISALGQFAEDLQNVGEKNANLKVGDRVSSVFLMDGERATAMYGDDIENCVAVDVSYMDQEMVIEFKGTLDELKNALDGVYDCVEKLSKKELVIAGLVNVTVEGGLLTLKWTASPVADLIADSVNMIAIQTIANPGHATKEVNMSKLISDEAVFFSVAEMQLATKFGEPVHLDVKEESDQDVGDNILKFMVQNPMEENAPVVTMEVNLSKCKVSSDIVDKTLPSRLHAQMPRRAKLHSTS